MSAEPPLVAIMMPSMNHERFVVEAVESVFAQGYPNLRVVICDDASTDSNYAKLQELASRFPIVLLKNEVRQGIVKTLNRCYAQCSDADYFYALASDDTMQLGMIKACIAEFPTGQRQVCCLGRILILIPTASPLRRRAFAVHRVQSNCNPPLSASCRASSSTVVNLRGRPIL